VETQVQVEHEYGAAQRLMYRQEVSVLVKTDVNEETAQVLKNARSTDKYVGECMDRWPRSVK